MRFSVNGDFFGERHGLQCTFTMVRPCVVRANNVFLNTPKAIVE
jgi:hypothetical protein